MNMKKHLLLFVACISIGGYAQVPDLPQVFSPDAAELGKYGKMPVNYFNGLPNITIPLTEVRAKNYTLPVYLSYHASGNKPENHPGWVGQGWTLHAGGCINRIIKGIKDEALGVDIYSHSGMRIERPGYLYNANQFQSINWNDTTSSAVSQYNRMYLLYNDIDENYLRDFEPDEFQISIEDINASFYFAGDGEIKIVSKSDDDFSVTYTMNDYAYYPGYHRCLDYKYPDQNDDVLVFDTFHEFIVTKKDGTKYHFGGNEDAIEFSMITRNLGENAPLRMQATANTWMLTKIERPDGEVINFNYIRGGVPIVKVDSEYWEGAVAAGYNSAIIGSRDGISFYYLLPSYLESINCRYGTDHISFKTSMSVQKGYEYTETEFRGKVLGLYNYSSLKARDYYLQLDTIETNHGMIICDYTSALNTRLKLNSVKIIAEQNDSLRYELTYNSTSLPGYNSRMTDPWGYYNSVVSYDCYPWGTLYDRRNIVNPGLLQAEMLTEIKYPTGGKTCFEYEPHDYSKVATQFPFGIESMSGQVGGLRIKKISDYPTNGQPEERLFTYNNPNGQSSGILSGKPVFYVAPTGQSIPYEQCNTLQKLLNYLTQHVFSDPDNFIYTAFSEHSLNQLSDTDGNHVTYSWVTETIPGSGKTEYRYSNHDSNGMVCMDKRPIEIFNNFNDLVLYNPFTSLSLSRGLLLKKASYNSDGDLVQEENNTYAQDLDDHLFSLSQYVNFYLADIDRRSLTLIYTYYPALTRKVVKTYPNGGGNPIEETTEYSYNSHRQLTKIVRRNSSSSEETRMSYSGDMPANKYPYGEMQAAGIFDRPVQNTVLRGIPIISSSLITYRKLDSLFVPDKYYESRQSSPIPAHLSTWAQYNGEITGELQAFYGAPRISFDNFDSYGNILSATDEGGRCLHYFWGCNGLNPEACFSGILKLEQTDDLGTWYYSFEVDGNHPGGFNSDKAWLGSKTFNHTIPSGIPYTIEWMEQGNDGEWTFYSAAFTGSKTIGSSSKKIDNVRIYPSAVTATNWTWTPNGELSSVTNEIGMTTSYEYDGMGRLTTVLDTEGKLVSSYEYHYTLPSVSTPDNYVKTLQYTNASGSAATETIRFHDGLGRPWQTLCLNAGRDDDGDPVMHLCERTDYDATGRPYRIWLPFRTTSMGPQADAPSSEYTYLYSDNEPYSFVEFDGSPLDRPRAEYGPGADWHTNGKAVCYEYKTNGSASLLNVTNYRINVAQDTTVTVQRIGKHSFRTLSVKIVTDEDGLMLLTFTDLFGRTVLERRHPASGDNLDTYYVYDAMGRLAAVLPPVLSKIAESTSATRIDNADLDKYAYLYTYDANGNCTAKKLPGCGWTRYIYDKGNRPVFFQDAENRRMGRWMFSFSDIHDRSCVSGYCEGDMNTLRQAVSTSNVVASRQVNSSGPYMGYSVPGLSLTNPVILSVSYYDDYGFIDGVMPSSLRADMLYHDEYDLVKWNYVHGLMTGSAERILGEGVLNDFRWISYYYDKKGNLIQTHTKRADGGVDVATTAVTFTGKPERIHISHDHGQSGMLNEFYEYTYDNWERPDTVRHRMGETGDWTVLSDYEYDGIGRVISDGKTSFTYNVRSWKTSITGPGLSEELFYEDGGQWGGNISEISWSMGLESEEFCDSYEYDDFSRLSSSTRYMTLEPSHRYINEYEYDEHGNIVQSRYKDEIAESGLIPIGGGLIGFNSSLIETNFSHDGNRLLSGSISNIMYDTNRHVTTMLGDAQQVAYAYDRNGRLTLSEYQGMTEIRYNAVGYPSYVELAGGGEVENKYTSRGTRLESRRMDANNTVTTMSYEGNEVFENGNLRMLLFDGGYVDFSGSEPRYCWYTKDHLGSVRAVSDSVGTVFSTYAYGPYGEDFAVEEPGIGNAQGVSSGNMLPVGEGPEIAPILNLPAAQYTAIADSDWQPYKFTGKESLTRVGLDLYDFGARMYSPSNMRWMTMDPLAEKYYHISPYTYCVGNPINRIDPTGEDPIFAKNFWGRVKQIGDDGNDNNVSYLVIGRMRKYVISSTKAGGYYSGPMVESSHVMVIPGSDIMNEIDKSVTDTKASGLENGGHVLKGENKVIRWDEGTPAREIKNKVGEVTGAKASMKSFTVNRESVRPKDASTISLWWHVHPDTVVGGMNLGSATPSKADKGVQRSLEEEKNGYTGNSFVIGARDKRVTFFNWKKALTSIKYEDFLRMGGLNEE